MFGLELKYSLLFGASAAFGIIAGIAVAAAIIETISSIYTKIKDFFLYL